MIQGHLKRNKIQDVATMINANLRSNIDSDFASRHAGNKYLKNKLTEFIPNLTKPSDQQNVLISGKYQ